MSDECKPRCDEPLNCKGPRNSAYITTVIWSTGFTGDFSWLSVPGAIADDGSLAQEKSLSVPGVYFAGLDTLESLMAGTVLMVKKKRQLRRVVHGVHREAPRIAE